MTFHCYCCGSAYERGQFKCCAAPKNMASHAWLERFCRVRLDNGKNCGKCPRCGCEHQISQKETGTEIGWSTPHDLSPKNHGELKQQVREWMPYRDPEEDG